MSSFTFLDLIENAIQEVNVSGIQHYFITISQLQNIFGPQAVVFIEACHLQDKELESLVVEHQANSSTIISHMKIVEKIADFPLLDGKYMSLNDLHSLSSLKKKFSLYHKGKKYDYNIDLDAMGKLKWSVCSLLREYLQPSFLRDPVLSTSQTSCQLLDDETLLDQATVLTNDAATRIFELTIIPNLTKEVRRLGFKLKAIHCNTRAETNTRVNQSMNEIQSSTTLFVFYGNFVYYEWSSIIMNMMNETNNHNGLSQCVLVFGSTGAITLSAFDDNTQFFTNELNALLRQTLENERRNAPISLKPVSSTIRSLTDFLSQPQPPSHVCSSCSNVISLSATYYKTIDSSSSSSYYHKKCLNVESIHDNDDLLNVSAMERDRVIKVLYERTHSVIGPAEHPSSCSTNSNNSDSPRSVIESHIVDGEEEILMQNQILINRIKNKILLRHPNLKTKELMRRAKHQYQIKKEEDAKNQMNSKPQYHDAEEFLRNKNKLKLLESEKKESVVVENVAPRKKKFKAPKECKMSLDTFQTVFDDAEKKEEETID
jgi:hypothetical protein